MVTSLPWEVGAVRPSQWGFRKTERAQCSAPWGRHSWRARGGREPSEKASVTWICGSQAMAPGKWLSPHKRPKHSWAWEGSLGTRLSYLSPSGTLREKTLTPSCPDPLRTHPSRSIRPWAGPGSSPTPPPEQKGHLTVFVLCSLIL